MGGQMKKFTSYTLLILGILVSLPAWIVLTITGIPQVFTTLFTSPLEQFGIFSFVYVFDYTINLVSVLATLVVAMVGIPVAVYFLIVSLKSKSSQSLRTGHHVMWVKSAIPAVALLIISPLTGQDASLALVGNPLSAGFFIISPILALVGLLLTPVAKAQGKAID
jgi:hypothetical protein